MKYVIFSPEEDYVWEEFSSLEEAEKRLDLLEEDDIERECYSPNFYQIKEID